MKVKPLVWKKLSSSQWSGRAVESYQCSIFLDDTLSPISYHLVAASFFLWGPTRFSTLKEAKCAAQKEWNAFILNCIE